MVVVVYMFVGWILWLAFSSGENEAFKKNSDSKGFAGDLNRERQKSIRRAAEGRKQSSNRNVSSEGFASDLNKERQKSIRRVAEGRKQNSNKNVSSKSFVNNLNKEGQDLMGKTADEKKNNTKENFVKAGLIKHLVSFYNNDVSSSELAEIVKLWRLNEIDEIIMDIQEDKNAGVVLNKIKKLQNNSFFDKMHRESTRREHVSHYFYNIGNEKARAGKEVESLGIYILASSLDGTNLSAFNNMAAVLKQLDKKELALEVYNDRAKEHQSDYLLAFRRVILMFQMGSKDINIIREYFKANEVINIEMIFDAVKRQYTGKFEELKIINEIESALKLMEKEPSISSVAYIKFSGSDKLYKYIVSSDFDKKGQFIDIMSNGVRKNVYVEDIDHNYEDETDWLKELEVVEESSCEFDSIPVYNVKIESLKNSKVYYYVRAFSSKYIDRDGASAGDFVKFEYSKEIFKVLDISLEQCKGYEYFLPEAVLKPYKELKELEEELLSYYNRLYFIHTKDGDEFELEETEEKLENIELETEVEYYKRKKLAKEFGFSSYGPYQFEGNK